MSPLSRLFRDQPVEYASHLQAKGDQSPETVRKKVRAAVAVLRWCWSRGYIKFQPEMPKLPKAVRRARDIPVTKFIYEAACVKPPVQGNWRKSLRTAALRA